MLEIFRGREQVVIRLDINGALGNVTIFNESGSYAISERDIRVPGAMFTIVKDGVMSVTLSEKVIASRNGNMRIMIDRARVKEPLILRTEPKNGLANEFVADEECELIEIRLDGGECVISTEISADAAREQELEEKVRALSEALSEHMPDAVNKALTMLGDAKAINVDAVQEFERVKGELDALNRENNRLNEEIRDMENETERVKRLVENARLLEREKKGGLEEYKKELDNYTAVLNVDQYALEYYDNDESERIINELKNIRELIYRAEANIAEVIRKRGETQAGIENKVWKN